MAAPPIQQCINLLTDLICQTAAMRAEWYANVGNAVSELLNAAALENAAQPAVTDAPSASGSTGTTGSGA